MLLMNKSQTIERKAGRQKRLFLEENDGSSLNSFRAQSSAELSILGKISSTTWVTSALT